MITLICHLISRTLEVVNLVKATNCIMEITELLRIQLSFNARIFAPSSDNKEKNQFICIVITIGPRIVLANEAIFCCNLSIFLTRFKPPEKIFRFLFIAHNINSFQMDGVCFELQRPLSFSHQSSFRLILC